MPCFYLFLIMHFLSGSKVGRSEFKHRASELLLFQFFFYCGWLLNLIIAMICQVVENSVL